MICGTVVLSERVSFHRKFLLTCTIALLCGCVSPTQISYEVIEMGNAVGLRRPYESMRVYSRDPLHVYRAVLSVLDLRGSQLLTAEEGLGVVSWADIGSSFVAITGQNKHDVGHSRLRPSLATRQGVIYGAVRIKPFKGGSWVMLKSVERERITGLVSFSDGTYERSLLNEIGRETQRSLAGDANGSAQLVALTVPGSKATTYSELYTKHFQNMPQPEANTLRIAGRREVYPAEITKVWEACIDVISQFDTVIQVSSKGRRIVFAHSLAVPGNISQKQAAQVTMDVNVVFSLYAEPRGRDGTAVNVAFFAPEGLTLTSFDNALKKGEGAPARDPKVSSTEIAAALIADEFFTKLTTQLYYDESWRGKLLRKSR